MQLVDIFALADLTCEQILKLSQANCCHHESMDGGRITAYMFGDGSQILYDNRAEAVVIPPYTEH